MSETGDLTYKISVLYEVAGEQCSESFFAAYHIIDMEGRLIIETMPNPCEYLEIVFNCGKWIRIAFDQTKHNAIMRGDYKLAKEMIGEA